MADTDCKQCAGSGVILDPYHDWLTACSCGKLK
jgi:predicted methyltransferase